MILENSALMKMQQLSVECVVLVISAAIVLNLQHQVQVPIQGLVLKDIIALLAQGNQKSVQGEPSLMCSYWRMQTSARDAQKVTIVESLDSAMFLDHVTQDFSVLKDQIFLIHQMLQQQVGLVPLDIFVRLELPIL